jgi:hypothetical protein
MSALKKSLAGTAQSEKPAKADDALNQRAAIS